VNAAFRTRITAALGWNIIATHGRIEPDLAHALALDAALLSFFESIDPELVERGKGQIAPVAAELRERLSSFSCFFRALKISRKTFSFWQSATPWYSFRQSEWIDSAV